MKNLLVSLSLVFVFSALFCLSAFKENRSFAHEEQVVASKLDQDFMVFTTAINQFSTLCKTEASREKLKAGFTQLRTGYKSLEWYLAYFAGNTCKEMNGALLNTVAFDDPNQVEIQPQGLQVIERLLFEEEELNYKALYEEIGALNGVWLRVKQLHGMQNLSASEVLIACQLELIRLTSMGLTGFDATISKAYISESAIALQELATVTSTFPHYELATAKLNDAALVFLRNSAEANFDYALFTAQYLQPLYAALVQQRKACDLPASTSLPVDLDKPSLFDNKAWNLNHFLQNKVNLSNPELIDLGKTLFYDPILSGNGKRACASCHSPEQFFADGKSKSIAYEFAGDVGRNAPSIINTATQGAWFWDSRVNSPEDQFMAVLHNPKEMNGSMDSVLKSINSSRDYRNLFASAYGIKSGLKVESKHIASAIAAFENSLKSYNAPFDKFMNGNLKALNAEQRQGLNLFVGKAQCASCHFLPTTGGTVPPLFGESEWEIIGVPANLAQTELDGDVGAYTVFKKDLHKFAFKTPSLRNVEFTAPYMHNGVFQSLEQVVDFYNEGGGQGLGYAVPNQTLPADKLNLNPQEKAALVAFMKALSDKKSIDFTKPKKLPALANAQLNKRKLGGEY